MDQNFDYSVVDGILAGHPADEISTIAILQEIQEYYHYLPEEIFPYVAKAIGVGEARLFGVATFYENFSLDPKGKYIIRCCDGTACHVRGSQPIFERLRHNLGLMEGHSTTDDMNFTIETVSCLGACGLAPAMTVNGKVYPAMSPDKASALIEELRAEIAKEAADE